MCDDQPYFVDARVGDTVYDMAYGEGVITGIDKSVLYVLMVNFPKMVGHTSFTLNGWYVVGEPQRLFYSKPIFELPPPPKRKVKKVIEGWVNIYPGSSTQWTSTIHLTESLADEVAMAGRLGKAHFLHHEYEE